jgi:hypothetical protein
MRKDHRKVIIIRVVGYQIPLFVTVQQLATAADKHVSLL